MRAPGTPSGDAGEIRFSAASLARNAGFNALGQVLPLLIGLATIPAIIRGFGVERFGVLSLVWIVSVYLNIFDLGTGKAVTKFVAEAIGSRTEDRIPTIVWTAAAIQLGLAALGGLVLVAGADALVGLLDLTPSLVPETTVAFRLLALALPATMLGSTFRGALEAVQRFDLVNYTRIPVQTMNFVAPLIAIYLGWALPGAVALIAAAQAAAAAAYVVMSMKVLPSLRRIRTDRTLPGRLVSFGGWLTISMAIAPVLLYLDRFAVGVLLSVGAVAFYAAPVEMVTRLWIIPVSVVAILFPAFSTLHASRSRREMEIVFARAIKYILAIVGVITIMMALTANGLIQLWLGDEFARRSTVVVQILAPAILVNSVAWVPATLLQAAGRPDIPAKLHAVEVPIHVAAVVTFVAAWGIAGAATAWGLRVTMDAALLFWVARRLDLVSMRALVSERCPQVVAGLIALAGLAWGLAATTDVLLQRAAGIVAGLLITSVVVGRHVVTSADRRLFRALLSGARRGS